MINITNDNNNNNKNNNNNHTNSQFLNNSVISTIPFNFTIFYSVRLPPNHTYTQFVFRSVSCYFDSSPSQTQCSHHLYMGITINSAYHLF